MHKTYVKKLLGSPRRSRGAARLGVTTGLACIASLLMMGVASLSMADQSSAGGPSKAAPPAASASAPKESSSAAPSAPPAAPPAAQGPYVAPKDIVFKRIEIFGPVLSSVRGGTWKAPKITKATISALVVTSSDPLPIGKQGVLFRKIEKPGAAPDWIKIADVTLKKVDPGGSKMEFAVDSVEKDVLIDGKKSDHFAKNVKIKVQMDVPVEQAP